jgi:hypothetical protein
MRRRVSSDVELGVNRAPHGRSKSWGGAVDVGRTVTLTAVTVWQDETQIYFQACLWQIKTHALTVYNLFVHFKVISMTAVFRVRALCGA